VKQRIAILGVGSLGGYLAESLASTDNLKELILIDPDIVQEKNVRNSIYTRGDIGDLKVNAMYNLLKSLNEDIIIAISREKFIEGETELPTCDLVIDCRDYVYDRGDIIDVRASISGRYLIIDCRKNITYPFNYDGRYNLPLKKTDLKNAALQLAILIDSNSVINQWVADQEIYELSLDHHAKEISREVRDRSKDTDLVYEPDVDDARLLKLEQSFRPIMEVNQERDVKVCLGEKERHVGCKIVPRGQLNTPQAVVSSLKSVMQLYPFERSFIIRVEGDHIQLLFVTGGA